MRSTFFGLNTLLRALQAQQQALDTTNHNIANAGTDGYSRQTVKLTPNTPYTSVAGNKPFGASLQLGTGVLVAEIRRERDIFLDLELRRQSHQAAQWETTASGLTELEAVFNEPGPFGLRSLMSGLFSAWGDLSNNPQSGAARSAVRGAAEQMTQGFNDTAQRLMYARQDVSGQIALKALEINDLGARIAELNAEIANVLSQGDAPNDLMDERDRLLDQVVSLAGATYRSEQDGTTTVLVDGRQLVSGNRVSRLVTEPKKLADGTQIHELKWAEDFRAADVDGGEVGGLIRLRDEIIPQQLRQLDLLASTIAGNVNTTHRGGFGIGQYASTVSNFFEPMMGAKLSESGLAHELVAGTYTIGNTTLSVDPMNQSITDVMNQVVGALNAQPGVTVAATWAHDSATGRVTLNYGTAAAGTTVKLGAATDSSNLLGLLGLVGASDTNTGLDGFGNTLHLITGTEPVALVSAAKIGLDAAIKADANALATAAGASAGLVTSAGPGDNRAALDILALQRSTFSAIGSLSFEEYYANGAAELGALTRQAEQSASTQAMLVEHLQARRESMQGVSLDEEATKLIQYQRAYQAAARGISALDEMLDTIISRMGRVGN